MDNENYKKILKEKKDDLINSLNLLDKNIRLKLEEKNNIIEELKKKNNNTLIEETYKIQKNKELDLLKLELNNILKDIDNIITNITK